MAARKNTTVSEEAREKIRKARKGKKPALGKTWKLSEDQKNKIKGAGNPNWKNGQGIYIGNKSFYMKQKYLERRNRMIGSHTFGEWELLKKQFGYRCPVCLRIEPEIKLTEDHIIPVSRGGSNYIENIQPLCLDCNKRKFTKIIKYSPEGEILAL